MLLVSVAVTVLLMVLPLDRVAYPLLLLSTLVHELGHGVAALLVGGDFVQLRMFGDASGFAVTAVRPGAFQHALVSAGGLIGPAVAACLGFLLGRNPRTARIACLGLGVFGILATVLWIRGAAGLLTALLFTVLSFVAGLAKPAWVPQLWLVFAAVQLSLSVFHARRLPLQRHGLDRRRRAALGRGPAGRRADRAVLAVGRRLRAALRAGPAGRRGALRHARATSPRIAASSRGRVNMGQWLVGRST